MERSSIWKIVGIITVATICIAEIACDQLEDNAYGDHLNLAMSEDGDDDSGVVSACPDGINTGPLPNDCVKIESDELGQVGFELHVGDSVIIITSWIEKDGESGEYIGFTFEVIGKAICLSIKCGGDVFVTNGSGTWVNPNGTSGPEAHAISNIVICNSDDPGGDSDSDSDSDGDSDSDSDGDTDPVIVV